MWASGRAASEAIGNSTTLAKRASERRSLGQRLSPTGLEKSGCILHTSVVEFKQFAECNPFLQLNKNVLSLLSDHEPCLARPHTHTHTSGCTCMHRHALWLLFSWWCLTHHTTNVCYRIWKLNSGCISYHSFCSIVTLARGAVGRWIGWTEQKQEELWIYRWTCNSSVKFVEIWSSCSLTVLPGFAWILPYCVHYFDLHSYLSGF